MKNSERERKHSIHQLSPFSQISLNSLCLLESLFALVGLFQQAAPDLLQLLQPLAQTVSNLRTLADQCFAFLFSTRHVFFYHCKVSLMKQVVLF